MVPIPTDPRRDLEDESVDNDVTASSSLAAEEVFLSSFSGQRGILS